jgi:hypothetical protein
MKVHLLREFCVEVHVSHLHLIPGELVQQQALCAKWFHRLFPLATVAEKVKQVIVLIANLETTD